MPSQRYPAFSKSRKACSELLCVGENRLTLIIALLVGILSLFPYFLIPNSASLFLQSVAGGASPLWLGTAVVGIVVFLTLYTVFLFLPFCVGLMGIASRIVEGETPAPADLFLPFSGSAAYERALGLSGGFSLRLGTLFLLACGTVFLTAARFGNGFLAIVICVFAVFSELTAWVALLANDFFTLWIAMKYPRMPLRHCRQTGRQIARCKRGASLRFFLGYLPWILLGFATIGILLLGDVLPRMMTGYFEYCNETNRLIERSEDDNNE